jgi:hypothetical protein
LAVVPLLLLLELTVANELVPPPPQPAAAASHASINIHLRFRIVFTWIVGLCAVGLLPRQAIN